VLRFAFESAWQGETVSDSAPTTCRAILIVTRVEELRSLCSNLRQRLAARQAIQAQPTDAMIAEAV
jgi:hypothetical protein